MIFLKKSFALLLIAVFLFGGIFIPESAHAAGDKVVITLDPGHGGPSDPGACFGQYSEKNLNLQMATKIKAILEANGNFIVYLTRSGDTALTKAQRLFIANSNNSDFLLSIHFDGSESASANGITVYTSVVSEFSPNALASSIASNLASVGFKNNGLKQRGDPECFWNSNKQWDVYDPSVGIQADYYGIISWGCKFGFPAIIVEHGYLSNSRDANFIVQEGTLDRMAEAEANALISYFAGHAHSYGAESVDYPSNCAIQGKSSSKCTICRHRRNVKTLPADPDNHYYYSDAIVSHKVSCDTEESISYKCRISENFIEKELPCEEHVLVDVLKPKTEHEYVVTYHQEVSHAVDGITRYSCKNCASNYTETVEAEGHSWVVKHTAPATCENSGAVTYVCPACREEYTENIPAFGHAYERVELITEPTCTEAGREKVRCSTCEKETEREISALGHLRAVMEHVDSSCTVQGYDKCYCNRCKTEYVEEIEKPSHEFEIILDTEVSCTVDGKTVSKCNLCGEEKTEIKAVASHALEVTEEKEPACEEEGYVMSACSVCGESFKDAISPLGHNYSEPVCVKRASAFTKGTVRFVCQNDESHFYDERIPSGFEESPEFQWELVLLLIFILISTADALLLKLGIIPFGFTGKKKDPDDEAADKKSEETNEENAEENEEKTEESEEKEPAAIEK